MNATIRAETIPIASEPRNIIVNEIIAARTSWPKDFYSSLPSSLTVSYITIPIASLKMLSPNTIEYKLTSASISLKIARTATGSVAEIKDPNAKLSFRVNSGYQLSGVIFANK